ncbi:MAG TPA: PQQ-binding-like beta-propeller repeat protein [Verrucomicrobiae bacterium]|nr:PQQ-binding-like beta-propeller repeat protein [Verrucomicrobiae bacterium]
MTRIWALVVCSVFAAATPAAAQVKNYKPVTQQDLLHPSPDDWLMFSRTYDAFRDSPLSQINTKNVKNLRMAWVRGLGEGTTETIPLVHDGVMYVIAPGGFVDALDATNGDLIWEYKRPFKNPQLGSAERTKALAIYKDMIYFTAADGYVVALDARDGHVRWETFKTDTQNTSGALVVDGKVISGGTCGRGSDSCFIEADDADTGEKVWRFYTVAHPDDPGFASWNLPDNSQMMASTWGLPGTFDPTRNVLYWGVANPMPDQRMLRHNGDPDGTSRKTPSDLYSNCTLALDPATGKLIWYYQHLPGDDWDTDHTHERTLARVAFNPNPKFVKWINSTVPRGSMHDIAAMVAEGGTLFVLDRDNGKFLWATPFPYDDPNYIMSDVDVKTGQTTLNWDLVFKHPGDHHIMCYWNTRSYWPTAYHEETQSLFVPYIDNCRDLTTNGPGVKGGWKVIPRPGSDPNALTGLARISLSTGETLHFDVGRAPSNGAMLTTAGGLVFHGDMSRRFRAFDVKTGEKLWEGIVGGNVSVSTITYAINGKQYICVMTGYNPKVPELSAEVPDMRTPNNSNAIYVFSLP